MTCQQSDLHLLTLVEVDALRRERGRLTPCVCQANGRDPDQDCSWTKGPHACFYCEGTGWTLSDFLRASEDGDYKRYVCIVCGGTGEWTAVREAAVAIG